MHDVRVTMPPIRLVIVGMAALVSLLMVQAVLPQSAGRDAQRNAATWYARAIEQYGSLSQSQRDILANYDPNTAPTPEVRAALSSVQGVLQTFQRGATMEYCDFNLDRAQGAELLLPHLSQMRQLARAMRADAAVRLHDGDTATAASRIGALYRMSGHAGEDKVIISSLVGQAVFHFADGLTQTALDRGALSAADSAALLAAAEDLGADDPFMYVEAVAGEQEMMIGWLEANFHDPEERQRLMGAIEGEMDPEQAEAIGQMDAESFAAELDDYDAMMTRMVEAFANPDPDAARAQLATLEKEIESGDTGFLIQTLMPALRRCYESKLKGDKAVAERIEVLRQLSAGEAKPDAFANAAVWYWQAIEQLERLDRSKLEAIRVAGANAGNAPDESLATTLLELQPIVDVCREGSLKNRCDFKFVRDAHMNQLRPPLVSPYAPGMNEMLCLLHADAARLLQARDEAGAIDRLTTSLRVQNHLGSDAQVSSALVAHLQFNRTVGLLRTALDHALLPEAFKPVLADEVDRFSRRDPFAYIAALLAAKEWLVNVVQREPPSDAAEMERRPEVIQRVQGFTGDQVIFIAVMLDRLQRNGERQALAGSTPTSPVTIADRVAALDREDAAWSRLSDIYPADRVAALLAELPQAEESLTGRRYDLFADRGSSTVPSIAEGGLAQVMRQARADLRRATILLAGPAVEPVQPD